MTSTECGESTLVAMANFGWIDKARNLKDCAEEIMRELIERAEGERGYLYGFIPAVAWGRLSPKNYQYALRAWCGYLLVRSKETELPVIYKPGTITIKLLRSIVKLSIFKEGPRLAQEHLAQCGIRLLCLPHLTRTYLDGAAMPMEGGPHNRTCPSL